MLIVSAKNISALAPVSDYEVRVQINERVIWKDVVTEHPRERGAGVLLRRIANQFEDAIENGEVEGAGRNLGTTEVPSGTPG